MEFDARSLPEESLRAHSQWVHRLALRLVRDPDTADDVVQETWVAALERRRERGPRPGSARAWFATVAENLVRRRARSEVRRADREADATHDDPLDGALLAQVEEQRAVVAAVMTLDDPTRTTLLLRYYKDLSAAEIARRQNVPPGTVRARLSRGLEELRRRLDARHGGDRAAWCAVLLGRDPAPAAPAPALSTPTLAPKGIAIMNTGALVAATVGTVAVAAVAFAVLRDEDAPQPVAAQETVETEPLVEPERALATPVQAPAREAEPERDVVAAAPRAAEPVPEAAPEPEPLAPCELLARFVDPDGRAAAFVRVTLDREDDTPRTSAETGADGRLSLALPMRRESQRLLLLYEAEGFVPGLLEVVAHAGESVNAGTTELVRGVLVRGHVVDPGGNPVDAARVFVRGAELPSEPEGQLHRRGPDGFSSPPSLLEVATDGGAFEVLGAADGTVRLWAHAPGTRYGWTEPLTLASGVAVDGVEIVVEALRPEDRIAGIVLDAAGEPLTDHSVRYRFGDEDLSATSGFTTDTDGRFELVLVRSVPHHFDVQGDEEHPGNATAGPVEPGTLDLVLALSEEGELELVVTDVEGDPVLTFEVETRAFFTENSSSSTSQVHETPVGRVRLAPPAGGEFELEIVARGYMRRVLGRFGGGLGIPAVLECVLTPTPGVHGRVTVDGHPVAGARVALHPTLGPTERYELNGFPCRMRPYAESSTVTDEDGRFALDVSDDGDYLVRAEVDGRATVESAVLGIVAANGYEGLELEAPRGGALVVTVRTAPGRDRAGLVVGITDGGPRPLTTRTDSAGEARFEGLRPGPWLVLEREEELNASSSSSTSWTGGEPDEIPWSCDVADGRTTTYELVLEDGAEE